jgi:SAM-dependent methyltransferase
VSDARRFAPATERNRGPILEVLRGVLPAQGSVLEIASGTGEHVVWLAGQLPLLTFQPSDPDADNRASIAAWIAAAGVTNVSAPLALDATDDRWAIANEPSAVLCINMIHIAPWSATLGLMRNAAAVLPPGGVLYLYGPFKRGGMHTAPSNADFDESLRSRNSAWAVRDLETVVETARVAGLTLADTVAMPANNLSVIFRRG